VSPKIRPPTKQKLESKARKLCLKTIKPREAAPAQHSVQNAYYDEYDKRLIEIWETEDGMTVDDE